MLTTSIVVIAIIVSASGTAWAARRINGAIVKPRSIPGNRLKPRAVGPIELRNFAVSAPKLRTHAVTAPKLATGAVDARVLADGSVGSTELADAGVQAADLATGAADSRVVADGSLTRTDIAGGVLPIGLVGSSSRSTALTPTAQTFARTPVASFTAGTWIITIALRNAVSGGGNWACDFYSSKDGAAATLFEVGVDTTSPQDRSLRQLMLTVPSGGASYSFEQQCTRSSGTPSVGSAELTVVATPSV